MLDYDGDGKTIFAILETPVYLYIRLIRQERNYGTKNYSSSILKKLISRTEIIDWRF